MVTCGDPAGIGAEITVAAWRVRSAEMPPFWLIDDPYRLSKLAEDVPVAPVSSPSDAVAAFETALPVLPIAFDAVPVAGRPDAANAPAVIAAIETAVTLCREGQASGMVTNPISKKVLYDGGNFRWPGHTEFLAHLGEVPRTVMMLAAPDLRVVPITVHIALAAVPMALTAEAIVESGRITTAALRRDFGIAAPRLAFAGLNPHAGEGGAMGREEIEIIAPAIETLKRDGIDAVGPLPADTMFNPAARSRYDVAMCMYHDQALVPLKTLDFARGVNVTLGLPFVRTSPDHGTAFNIAGTGRADPTSLIEALMLAGRMAEARSAATGEAG
ncbi:MAG: 4-hydroxythreonine-4-phosphate dehydrogenase PdxA [Pseudomonadota bacterium]